MSAPVSAKPLCIDLFCGLGGWAEGFLAEGWDVIGFDIERHDYGTGGYPGQLVLQDVLTLHGSQFRNAAVIVASPPCQAYSYRAMPWKRAKALPPPSNELFDACFRIAKEAGVPIVVENVKGAQPWVGRAKWHYGSYYLWGDVPALMPLMPAQMRESQHEPLCETPEGTGRTSWFFGNSKHEGRYYGIKGPGGDWFRNPVHEGVKVAGLNWSGSDKPGYVARAFNDTAASRFGWRDSVMDKGTSKGHARKAASAQIAKIPLPLAQWIARGSTIHKTLDPRPARGVKWGR